MRWITSSSRASAATGESGRRSEGKRSRLATRNGCDLIMGTQRIRGRARAERNARILRRDPVCYICGLSIDLTIPWPQPMCGVVDHVIAINRGGKDDATNLRSAHNK